MATAEEWERRYREIEYWAGTEPVAFLRQVLPLLTDLCRPTRGALRMRAALDVAGGEGRNAVFLAENGWDVRAVDRSRTALDKAEALARARGVPVFRGEGKASGPHGHLRLLVADLEKDSLPTGRFDLVLCFYYLQRSLFPAMERALGPAGVLVYETYTVDQLDYREGPRNQEFLLERGELRQAFPSLDTLFCAESNSGKGIASLLARRPVAGA